MIEFSGEITGKCKRYILKREAKIFFSCFSIASVIISIPIIILAINNSLFWGMMAVPGCGIILSSIPLFLRNSGMKDTTTSIPDRVVIDGDGEMISESSKFQEYRAVSQVKKVLDMSEWYVITFYHSHRTLRFVCQKDLIVQGTIEEFENLFDGKIIRKIEV